MCVCVCFTKFFIFIVISEDLLYMYENNFDCLTINKQIIFKVKKQ